MTPKEKAPPGPPPIFFPYDRVMFTDSHWNVLWEYGRLGLRQLRISTRGSVVAVKANGHVASVKWDGGPDVTDHFTDNLEVIRS